MQSSNIFTQLMSCVQTTVYRYETSTLKLHLVLQPAGADACIVWLLIQSCHRLTGLHSLIIDCAFMVQL